MTRRLRALALVALLGLPVGTWLPAPADAEVALWLSTPRGTALDVHSNRLSLFGESVVATSDTLLVLHRGGVSAYERSGPAWTYRQELPHEGPWFGASVALAGDTAVVGHPGSSYDGTDLYGRADVYVRTGGAWSLQATLVEEAPPPGEAHPRVSEFGRSVALSGDTLVVGAKWFRIGGQYYLGAAHVFTRSGSTWTPQARLTGVSASTFFGTSVSISGDTLVVGAEGTGYAAVSGAAHIFQRSGGMWSRVATFEGQPEEYYGHAVALSGDLVAVGAPAAISEVGRGPGSVEVLRRDPLMGWRRETRLQSAAPEADDRFGLSLALAGDSLRGATLVAGAPGPLYWRSTVPGAAFAFAGLAGLWSEQARLALDDGAAGDNAGFAVAWSRGDAFVAAPWDDTARGVDTGSVLRFRASAYVG